MEKKKKYYKVKEDNEIKLSRFYKKIKKKWQKTQ